jgi:ubiquinone/menaquinone biosynthesis C-methylase UbiE
MSNTERFTGRAEVYSRYRQRYSNAEILPLLEAWCSLQSDWLIADIGAGTGMLSEVFLANGNPVIAVEPNSEMRASCAQLVGKWATLSVLDGTAEATGLEDSSVDMVAAGRALHWFNIPLALAEFRRILRPSGWMTLISLGRSKADDEQSIALERLLLHHAIDPTYRGSGYRIHEDLQDLFATDYHQAQIHGEEHLDWDAFLGSALSFSVTPNEDSPSFPAFAEDLRRHFDTYAMDGTITMPTTCWVTAGRLSTR